MAGREEGSVLIVEETNQPARYQDEVRYQVLVADPAVRHRLAEAGRNARTALSEKQVFAIVDSLKVVPVSLDVILKAAMPVSRALGFGSKHSEARILPLPVGETIVRILVSLALNGQKLHTVQQAAAGCVFGATIPMSIFMLRGELTIGVERVDGGTAVGVTLSVPGQMFAWGAQRRIVLRLLQEIE